MRGNYLTLLVVAEVEKAIMKVTVPLRRGNYLTQPVRVERGSGGPVRFSAVLDKQ